MKNYPKPLYLLLIWALFQIGTIPVSGEDNPSYFSRHYVVVVDETPDFQTAQGLDDLKTAIKHLFKGDKDFSMLDPVPNPPKDLVFDPRTDQISLFVFGLPGTQFKDGPYRNIVNQRQQGASAKELYDLVNSNLIHKRKNFHESGKSLDDFLNGPFDSLFDCSDPIYKEFRMKSGVTLSYYVYPAILNFLDNSIPAEEYYLIIVSNFNSGVSGAMSTQDYRRLEDLVGRNNAQEIKNFYSDLDQQFSRNKRLEMVAGSNRLAAFCSKIGVQSVGGAMARVSSSISFNQLEHKGKEYEMGAAEVTFSKDESLVVNRIEQILTDSKTGTEYKYTLAEGDAVASLYNGSDFKFRFPKRTVQLDRYEVNDKLKVEYILYTSAVDSNTGELIPIVYRTDQDFQFTESDLVRKDPYQTAKRIALGTVLGLLLLSGLYWLYLKRGWSRKAELSFRIIPISNTRFMEVRDRKVINYDCWYYRPNLQFRIISVEGNLDLEKKKFAKRYDYSLSYLVTDEDNIDEFTFRPNGNEPNGDPMRCKKRYKLHLNDDKSFKFSIVAYVDDNQVPDFTKENILEMKVAVTAKVSRKSRNKTISEDAAQYEEKYSFIVKPAIDRPNLWMAFDPGTTGSCVAYAFGGNQNDRDNIRLAQNLEGHTEGEDTETVIYPSAIQIQKLSEFFRQPTTPELIESMEEGFEKDYFFGNTARQRFKDGENCFQSIKKLLGYTTPQLVTGNGRSKEIEGRDLAHLLVKGLYGKVTDYILNRENRNDIRDAFLDENGNFCPSRAIVAVPNNYTMVKIQEMVDTVKRLKIFKEVHYLYESEGVFMTYLRYNWAQIPHMTDKLFVVYDMGGATINATAFIIKDVELERVTGNIRRFAVETVSKIGYTVGGDDIDFALLKMIYGMPSVKKAFEDRGVDAADHMNKHKYQLIDFIGKFKLDYIDHVNGREKEGNTAIDFDTFRTNVSALFGNKKVGGILIDTEDDLLKQEDLDYIELQKQSHPVMDAFVFSKVRDAVSELLTGLPESVRTLSEIELIMSGRSILYPGIQHHVLNTVRSKGFKCDGPWKGFNNPDGSINDELVKTAVASGACWYALFSNNIIMKHDLVTSTFGYIDYINAEQRFVPLIDKNAPFDINGKCSNGRLKRYPYWEGVDVTIPTLRFVQMLGSNFDEIYHDGEIRIPHKINILDIVQNSTLTLPVSDIEIQIDDQNNFTYSVKMRDMENQPITQKNNPDSRLKRGALVRTEIGDENSEAYIYAALTANVIRRTVASNREEVEPATTINTPAKKNRF